MATLEEIEEALTNVIDPELGLDFVELGLIYGIQQDAGNVHVTFTLTTPACPIGPQITEQIEEFVAPLEGVALGPELDDLRAAVVAGEDERGREVRAGLLSPLVHASALRANRPSRAASRWRSRCCSRRPARAAATQRTGRLLVTLEPQRGACARPRRTLDGVRRDGAQIPQIGVVSVKPVGGQYARRAVASALRKRAGVAHVEVEHRHELRFVPNDPALTTLETAPGHAARTRRLSGGSARMGLPAAWDLERGDGATVAVIDTGARRRPPRARRARSRARSTTTRRPARARRPATRTATARTSRRSPARPATTAPGSSARA